MITLGSTVAVSASAAKTAIGSISSSATQLPTKITISGTSVPVAWYGKVQVYATDGTTVIATYNTTLSSNGNYVTVPTIKGRKMKYTLYAYAGVVVNKNGSIVTTKQQDIAGDKYTKVSEGNYVLDNAHGEYMIVDGDYVKIPIVPAAQAVVTTSYTVTVQG